MKFRLISAVCLCLIVFAASAQDNEQAEANDTTSWKSFSATLLQKDVYLQWLNNTEPITSFFIIEKSSDGINFSEIGRIQSTQSPSAKTYSLTDAAPLKGSFFYRIKSVRSDEDFSYSPVKKITAGERQALLQLLQNPVSGNNLQVAIHGQQGVPYTIRIYNAQAKLLLQKAAASGNNTIDLSPLTPGLYLAELLQNDQPAGERLWVVKQ